MTIGDMIYDFTDSIKDSIYQMSLYNKKQMQNKITVKMHHKHRNIETYTGLLSPEKEFVLIQGLNRVIRDPVIESDGKLQVIHISANNHTCMFNHIMEDLSTAITTDMLIKWQHGRKWVTTKVVKATTSIDYTLFDNPIAIPYAIHTNMVIQAKNLSLLLEVANSKLLMSMAISWLVGIIMGMILNGYFGK